MRRLITAAIASLLLLGFLSGCGSSGHSAPKTQMLRAMHKVVPNDTDDVILSDADVVCAHSESVARRNLLDDSMASTAGVNELPLGSAALARYVDRIIEVVHDTHYCRT